MAKKIQCSPTFGSQIGHIPAFVYDFIVGWIYSNYQKKRKTAFEDGKWWSYGTSIYYANELGLIKRTFQRAVDYLVKNDYLQVKHKGKNHELWFCLGSKMPNVPLEELPYNGAYSELCANASCDNLSSLEASCDNLSSLEGVSCDNLSSLEGVSCDNLSSLEGVSCDNLSRSCDNLSQLDADAPSNGGASEAPKHINKHTKLKNNNNIEASKSEKAPESEKTNQNSLTPMSGIIDTLLNQLQGSSVVVVDENLSDVLGIDLNDPSCHDKIVAIGVSLNVERETMSNLIQKYGLPAVAKQLVNLHYQQKVSPAGNPAGWLVSAVARNYALSQQALECIKTQRQKQKEREEFQAKVARMRAEDAERQKRETEEFRKNGPDFDTMPDILLAAWLRRDSEKFIEKKYRAYLAGKGIPEDQHDKIVEKMRNFHPDHK